MNEEIKKLLLNIKIVANSIKELTNFPEYFSDWFDIDIRDWCDEIIWYINDYLFPNNKKCLHRKK